MSTDKQQRMRAPGAGTGFPGLDAVAAAGGVAPPSATTVAGALAVVRAAVEREEQAAGAPALRRRVHGRRRWVVAGVAVAAVATGVAVLPVVDLNGRTAANASAATFLNETAEHAAAAGQHGGKYWKVVTAAVQAPGTAERRMTQFVSRDKARMTTWFAGGRTGWAEMEYPGQWRWGTGPTTVTWDQLDNLPTGTAALRARLTGPGGGPGETFAVISSLLSTSPAGPKLRAALYRVLATTPGIHLNGAAKDSRGRSGTSVSITYGIPWGGGTVLQTGELLIAPRTGVLLQSRWKSTASSKEALGKLPTYSNTTYLFTGWVNEIS
jgi:hypothetical protein